MINNDNDNKILKDAFDAELMKRLESNPPEILSYEEFSAMADRQLNKRRRKSRIIGIAASLAIVLLASIFAATQLTPDVDADKNPKEEIITEDGVIIEDGGWGSSEDEDNVRIITDWALIEEGRDIVPDLLIPKYIPEGYEFEQLKIEVINEDMAICEFFFNNGKRAIEIESQHCNSATSAFKISDIDRELRTDKGIVYIQEKNNKIATIQTDDGIIIYILGSIADDEIISIIDSLSV